MAGVKRKRLVFVPAKLTDLTKGLTPEAEAQIADLHTRIPSVRQLHYSSPPSKSSLPTSLDLLSIAFTAFQRSVCLSICSLIYPSKNNIDFFSWGLVWVIRMYFTVRQAFGKTTREKQTRSFVYLPRYPTIPPGLSNPTKKFNASSSPSETYVHNLSNTIFRP